MTLVALLGVFGALVFGLATSLLAHEVKGWLPYLSRFLVRRAGRLVPRRHRDRYVEEWLGQVEAAADRPLFALLIALRLSIRAYAVGRARRGASPLLVRALFERQVMAAAIATLLTASVIVMLSTYAALPDERRPPLASQVGALTLGTVVALVILRWPRLRSRRHAVVIWFAAGSFATAWITNMFGLLTEANGGNWVVAGPVVIQLGPIITLAVLLVLAQVLASDRPSVWSHKFPTGFWVICALAYVAAGDHLSALIPLALGVMCVWVAAGIPLVRVALISLIGVACAWFVATRLIYVGDRWTAFLSPSADSADSAYQQMTAWEAMSSGGFFGRGPGNGDIIDRLPQAADHSALAAIAEQFGVFGAGLILVAFLALGWSSLRIAARSATYERYAIVGLASFVLMPALLHALIMVGLIPTIGVSLPLISVSPTVTLCTLAALGLLWRTSAPARGAYQVTVRTLEGRAAVRFRMRQVAFLTAAMAAYAGALAAVTWSSGGGSALRVSGVGILIAVIVGVAAVRSRDSRENWSEPDQVAHQPVEPTAP